MGHVHQRPPRTRGMLAQASLYVYTLHRAPLPMQCLAEPVDLKTAKILIKEVDTDGSGELDFLETVRPHACSLLRVESERKRRREDERM